MQNNDLKETLNKGLLSLLIMDVRREKGVTASCLCHRREEVQRGRVRSLDGGPGGHDPPQERLKLFVSGFEGVKYLRSYSIVFQLINGGFL